MYSPSVVESATYSLCYSWEAEAVGGPVSLDGKFIPCYDGPVKYNDTATFYYVNVLLAKTVKGMTWVWNPEALSDRRSIKLLCYDLAYYEFIKDHFLNYPSEVCVMVNDYMWQTCLAAAWERRSDSLEGCQHLRLEWHRSAGPSKSVEYSPECSDTAAITVVLECWDGIAGMVFPPVGIPEPAKQTCWGLSRYWGPRG